MEKKKFSTRYLAEVALFVGVILVMKIKIGRAHV